jgi:hypothetical protein
MKQKMKILTTIALITLLLFNSSCEKDLYEDAIQQNNNFKFKTVNFSEVKKINAKTAQFIENKINKNISIQARTSELYGKTVDTTNINYLVKDDGYSSFTFKVENDSIGINYIENIIVENYPNQEQEVLLVKYNLNTSVEQFYSNDDSLQNSLTSTETSLYQNTTQSFSRYSCITVGYWDTVDACEGEVDISEHPECLNADGTRATKEVFITIAEDCGFDSGGGGDGGYYGGDPNNGNYDNGSNGGGNYNGAGIFIPNIYNGDEDPNNAEFILAGQVSQYFNSLPQNIKALSNNNTWVYSYLVDYFRNNGNIVNTRNSQYATNALNNYYNFQLNSYNPNFLFVDLERFNFWAYYTFLNNNLLINNTQNVFDIRDFVMNTDSETAHNIINYLFFNKDNQEAIEFVKELMDLEINGNLLNFFPTFKYPAGSNYSTQYPKLTEFLKNKIPELKNNQFIINKLVQYSELSSQQVINDLKWGKGPTIQIAQLDSRGVDCYGIFSSATPNVLTIDIDFVNLLENSTPGPEGDSLAFLLGVTILHEYVHLGDFVDGIDQPGEEGLLFEQATYGETIWLSNAGDVLIKWQ